MEGRYDGAAEVNMKVLIADFLLLFFLTIYGFLFFGWEGALILSGIYIMGQGIGIIINGLIPVKKDG